MIEEKRLLKLLRRIGLPFLGIENVSKTLTVKCAPNSEQFLTAPRVACQLSRQTMCLASCGCNKHL